MSSVERRLAQDILKFVSPKQAETVETDNPSFALHVKALSRHMTGDVPDEQYAFREIAIKALVQSILPHKYSTALRLQNLEDVNAQFDRMATNFNLVVDSMFNTSSVSQPANRRRPFIKSLKDETARFREDLG